MKLSKLDMQDILKHTPPEITEVEVPEWGGSVFVKTMTGKERDNWELQMARHRELLVPGNANIRAYLVVTCACDENREPLFSMDDLEAVGSLPAVALDRLVQVITKVNRLEVDVVEKTVKN